MNDKDLTRQILAGISALPPEQQPAAILRLISEAMRSMPVERVHEIRAEIVGTFDVTIPIVAQALDMIEGHLALREIAKEDAP